MAKITIEEILDYSAMNTGERKQLQCMLENYFIPLAHLLKKKTVHNCNRWAKTHWQNNPAQTDSEKLQKDGRIVFYFAFDKEGPPKRERYLTRF